MYERPGRAFYVPAATKATKQNAAVTENGVVGAAQKTRPVPWSAGLAGQADIAVGEPFTIRTKGIHQFANTGITAGVLGDAVFINPATNALNLTTGLPFGRIVELPGGNRGVPTAQVRIDLDQKDTITVP